MRILKSLLKSPVIEFLGFPGSGKTTLARLLAAQLNEKGFITEGLSAQASEGSLISRLGVKAFYSLKGICLQPRSVCSVPLLINKTKQRSKKDYAINLVNTFFIRGLVSGGFRRDCVVILDQGALQGLWSFRISSSNDCFNHQYYHLVSGAAPCRLVFLVHASLDDILQRLSLRPPHLRGRFWHWMQGGNRADTYSKIMDQLVIFASCLDREKIIKLVHLENPGLLPAGITLPQNILDHSLEFCNFSTKVQ